MLSPSTRPRPGSERKDPRPGCGRGYAGAQYPKGARRERARQHVVAAPRPSRDSRRACPGAVCVQAERGGGTSVGRDRSFMPPLVSASSRSRPFYLSSLSRELRDGAITPSDVAEEWLARSAGSWRDRRHLDHAARREGSPQGSREPRKAATRPAIVPLFTAYRSLSKTASTWLVSPPPWLALTLHTWPSVRRPSSIEDFAAQAAPYLWGRPTSTNSRPAWSACARRMEFQRTHSTPLS